MNLKTHIQVNDLDVRYGPNRVLNHISLNIPDKKITAIMGPSGCGKTTLLKSLNRLIELQDGVKITGEVLIDGENILDPKVEVTRLRKKVGLLLQKPQVLPMSIYDNVAYGPVVHGFSDKKGLDELVERHLRQANLWKEVKDRLHTSAARLSIGQQQRLCLARTLAIEPEVILGDEATSALDPVSAQQIEQLFLQLKDQYSIVLVTHNLRQAKRLADYVVFLYLGNLIEHGPAAEFFNNPRYAKTKAYIEGRFIEEFAIDKEIDLRGFSSADAKEKLKALIKQLAGDQVVRALVDKEESIQEITAEVEYEGHSVVEVKRLAALEWEVIIQKQNVSYTI